MDRDERRRLESVSLRGRQQLCLPFVEFGAASTAPLDFGAPHRALRLAGVRLLAAAISLLSGPCSHTPLTH